MRRAGYIGIERGDPRKAVKSINEAALSKAQQTLSKMERALKMIHDPDFGLCRECEEPIPFARLMIVPESDLCVECAEAIVG